jgi:hypothetical protein
VPLGHPAEEAGGTTSLADALPVTIRRNQQEDVMRLPLRPVLIAIAVIAATGAANAQTIYVQQTYDPVVSEPIAVTPVERTTVYRNIFPQGPGLAPVVRERIVTERFAPGAVRERVVVQPQETVVVAPRDYTYASAPYGYGYNNYGYNNYGYAYEVAQPVVTERVVTRPVVTERVVTRPAITVYGARDGYAVRDAYARVAGPAREVVYEVDAAPRLTCKQRFRSWDPRTQTYLGFDGLRHPCVD